MNFVQSGRFQLGLALRESASQPVTLTDVRAVFPHGSVLRQLGTALAPQNPMFPCGISKPRRFGALRATRLPVAPRKYACVQLNFQFLGCPAARHASLRDVRMLDVSYRTRAGAVIRQRVGLGDAHLLIVPTVESPLLSDRWARRVVHPCGR